MSSPPAGTVAARRPRGGRPLRGRPELFTTYKRELSIFNTPAKRLWMALLLVGLVVLPFTLDREMNLRVSLVFAAAIGAIGLNLVSGYAGQLSLGHAFFIGLGAYTGAIVSAPTGARLVGFGIDNMLIWLPLAGLVPALVGFLVAPIAVRVRGLYLAIVTLGLVFIGQHVFREARTWTGGAGVGRDGPVPDAFGFRFDRRGEVFGVLLQREQKMYFLTLVLLVVLALLAKNLARSAVGRAFSAVRDRDIAAAIMGVDLLRHKVVAFTVSSFYAGIAGGLVYAGAWIEPGAFNLLMSVRYIAMILIGGVATISGSIMGAGFIELLPRFVDVLPRYVPFISPGAVVTPGTLLTKFQLEQMFYGLFIILFIILEPRGLYGLWIRVRNYFKAWPFSY